MNSLVLSIIIGFSIGISIGIIIIIIIRIIMKANEANNIRMKRKENVAPCTVYLVSQMCN